jgi:hypothetical protein
MVAELTSGPLIALEVRPTEGGADPVKAFRELAGPTDAAIAKALRTHTLRAKYGIDKVY